MRKKYNRKKSTKSKLRTVLLTTLLVSVAFLLGLWTERSDISFQWIETYINDITSQIQSFRFPFTYDEADGNIAELHFFDVGQGSSVLLEAYDGTSILIDTGRFDDSESEIVNYLNDEIGVGGEIDLVIFTHNDADHIGNGDIVLEYFQVEEVWMNGMDHTSQTYSDVLDAMLEADVAYSEPKAGESTEVGPFSIQVLHPMENEKESTQNEESIVTRITFGGTSLMHSGDVNSQVENRIVTEYAGKLQSDIMVLGHHGSSTSTSEEWLSAVDPSVAIYQAGASNHYGHPHSETLEKFTGHSAELLGTDTHGTIHINVKDDNQLEIFTEEGN